MIICSYINRPHFYFPFRVEAYGFNMGIHTGTHIDVPCHVHTSTEGLRLHEVPLERFFGPACVMDCKAQVDEDSDYQFSMADFEAWEKKNGKVPEGAYVLVCYFYDIHSPTPPFK